ncbi:MAG: DUF1501 domain-containing protein, partial [Chloroherpetonaceae bacterium]|nr:DUF1501 domain-containing protein [Chloroherpetonaceae bacterium]
NRFGQSCLLARRLIESGVRFVTVRMFDPAHPGITWDAHGALPFPSLHVYRTHCGPWFDAGYTALLEDLIERGLYERTVVCAMGEFGRTPRLNAAGGRDHWPHCWSLLIGGGGIRGGQVVGASDAIGGYPQDRPIPLRDVTATLYAALGIPWPDRAARPVQELF